MSRGGEVRLPFGGEERNFRLRIGELRQVQEACGDVGPEVVADRLDPRRPFPRPYLVDDVRAPILFGLIGGGMDGAKATRLVVQWLDNRQDIVANMPLARSILLAALSGPADEPLPVPKEEGTADPPGKATAEAAAGSPSPSST